MGVLVRRNNAKSKYRWTRAAIVFFSAIFVLVPLLGAPSANAGPQPPQGSGQGPGEPERWLEQLPPGDGHDIVAANCILCHTVERIVTSHRAKAAWDPLVKLMAMRGCPIDDQQVATVIDYLSKNFGRTGKTAQAAQPSNSERAQVAVQSGHAN